MSPLATKDRRSRSRSHNRERGRRDHAGNWFRNSPSLAVALNCGTGSSLLKAPVNALDRLHIVRGENFSYCGSKYSQWTSDIPCGRPRGAPSELARNVACAKKGQKPVDLGAVLDRKIKPAFAKVGIGDVGWHTFRHTVGTMLAEMGEHQLTIRDYLRHSNLNVTNKYLQAKSKTKRSAQDKLVDAILPTGVLSQSRSTLIQ
jgi:Phage integrase family